MSCMMIHSPCGLLRLLQIIQLLQPEELRIFSKLFLCVWEEVAAMFFAASWQSLSLTLKLNSSMATNLAQKSG